MSNVEVSIILPVYNQADHIERIVKEYQEALQTTRRSYELLLIVNGSLDASYDICCGLAREDPAIHAFLAQPAGWGNAVITGIKNAEGALICYTNCARTSAKDLALVVVYGFVNSDAVVKANRKIRETLSRRLGSLLYNLECRMLFDLSYWDINGTPKVFPRKFDKLLQLSATDDLIDLEFNIICREQDYPVLEVPIFSSRRHGGASTTNYRSALRLYLGAFKLWRNRMHCNETRR